jgi:hypothetical protein
MQQRFNNIVITKWHKMCYNKAMNKVMFMAVLVALGLIITGSSTALAKESKTKNAEKVIHALKKLDLYDPAMKDAIMFVDERINDGYLEIADEEILGYQAKLQYDIDDFELDNLELKFKDPQRPNYEFVATPSGAMLRYSTEF